MPGAVSVLILGTGAMAQMHASAYKAMVERRFTSLNDAIEWGGFDAASNVTPDGAHYKTTMALLAANKHVLCEKPLATRYKHAQEMADLASQKKIVHSINLRYREVPALHEAASLVAAGEIGEVRHFEASYLQSWLTQPAWGDWKSESQWLWRLSTEHGSNGVLGDVGIHILDFATFVAGDLPIEISSKVHTFNKSPGNAIGEYTLDANDSFVMYAQMANGALGTIAATRFASGHHNDLRLRLYGDKGGLEVLFEKNESRLNVCLGEDMLTEHWREVACDPVARKKCYLLKFLSLAGLKR